MTKILHSQIVVIIFLLAAAVTSEAALLSSFHSRVLEFQKQCATLCSSNFHIETQTQFPSPVRHRLQNLAKEQAQFWGDSILEGDYFSEGPTSLNHVEAIYKDKTVVAYRISYSEPAWYTGECDFNPENQSNLKNCKKGSIKESSFVSPDFKESIQDRNNIATFIAQ